jgi:hypothetical protein
MNTLSTLGSFITRSANIPKKIQISRQVTTQTYTDATGTYTQYYFLATSGTHYIRLNNFTTTQTLSILCIGGGGGGGYYGGGGGAGGFRESSITLDPANFTSEIITCVVGTSGGGSVDLPVVGNTGGNTTVKFKNNTINDLISQGGGGGGSQSKGGDGASGGGNWGWSSGLTTASLPEYGNNGGYSPDIGWISASGGGGAGGVGGASTTGGSKSTTKGGFGGIGKNCSLSGISNALYWAGGGGGMCQGPGDGLNKGGNGGGGGGYSYSSPTIGWNTGSGYSLNEALNGHAGANTGGGGGGCSGDAQNARGGNGGSGIVIISIKNADES